MPGLNRRGPHGAGPMTGGRRGRCSNADYYQPPSQAFGIGRGGRPWGGGRGRAWGGGYGGAGEAADEADILAQPYPLPSTPASGWLSALDRLLIRLNQLASNIAEVNDRIAGERRSSEQGTDDEPGE